MPRISAIELENFQSIETRTRFDLKPITLLFGPNSAGKSAIFDAFELLRSTLDPLLFDAERVTNMIDRWARNNGHSDVRETFVAIEFQVDLGVEPQHIWWTTRGSHSSKSFFPSIFWDEGVLEDYDIKSEAVARVELRFRIQNHKTFEDCFISESRCYLNGKVVAAIQKKLPNQREDSLNDSSAATDVQTNDDATRYLLIPARSENIFLTNGELGPGKVQVDDEEFGPYVHFLHICSNLSPFDVTPSFFGASAESIGELLCQNITDIFFYLGTSLCGPWRSEPGLVRGDRRTPSPKEASVFVDLELGGWWSRNRQSPSSPAALLKKVSADIDEHVKALAILTHADAIYRASSSDSWGDSHAAKHLEDLKALSDQLGRLNKHLEASLFTEKLYQLCCESTLMVPLDFGEFRPDGYYLLAQPAAVRLMLRDESGMKLELQDVGSGIPYVLPVLYSVTSGGLSMVQQPELHLHPALQSALADIFIEEFNEQSDSQFLIETHSEHLLLRALRRIRDTERKKSLSSSFELTNNQVAVYYFDPQVGGETRISALPISPLGDFYTDWPRGFFEERNDDLFDED